MATETTTNAVDATQQVLGAQFARMEAAAKAAAELEAKALERARQALEDSARLARESIEWYAQMSAAWRRMALDAAKQATDLAGFPS